MTRATSLSQYLKAEPPASSKYGNEKCVIDGIKFDSKKEAKRYGELSLLVKAKLITELRMQVAYELVPAQRGGIRTERAINYVADFVYVENGKTVIEDTKGFRTKEYLLKRKMMKMLGLEITEL